MKPHLQTIDRRKLARLWQSARSLDEIAAALGCAVSSVYTIASREGLPYRRAGKRPPRGTEQQRSQGIDWLEAAQDELFPGRAYADLSQPEWCAVVARARVLLNEDRTKAVA